MKSLKDLMKVTPLKTPMEKEEGKEVKAPPVETPTSNPVVDRMARSSEETKPGGGRQATTPEKPATLEKRSLKRPRPKAITHGIRKKPAARSPEPPILDPMEVEILSEASESDPVASAPTKEALVVPATPSSELPRETNASATSGVGAAAAVEAIRNLAAHRAVRPGRLYGWGLAKSGGLLVEGKGKPGQESCVDKEGDCAYPARCMGFPKSLKFVKVSADTGSAFGALDEKGKLWGWGMKNPGARGSDIPEIPMKVDYGPLKDQKIADCSVGASFIVAVTEDGACVTVGKHPGGGAKEGGKSPRGGASLTPDGANKLPDVRVLGGLPAGVKATWCEAGGDSVLVIGDNGKLYGCGHGATNGLGKDSSVLEEVVVSAGSASDATQTEDLRFSMATLGSRHGAAVTEDGRLFTWGDGRSGNLGLGKGGVRSVPRPTEVVVPEADGQGQAKVIGAWCTRGQPNPKRDPKSGAAGQEGPRMHVVTEDGSLWISGTSHKGLAANCLWKTMAPDKDCLSLYRVGGPALDYQRESKPGGGSGSSSYGEQGVATGAVEDFLRNDLRTEHNSTASESESTSEKPVKRRKTLDKELSGGKAMADVVAASHLGMSDISEFGKDGNTGYLNSAKIVTSQPLHIHSLAMDSNGRCYSWGCGSSGRTGLQAFMRGPRGAKRRLKCYVSSPTAVEELEEGGKTVEYVTGGRYWSFAILN